MVLQLGNRIEKVKVFDRREWREIQNESPRVLVVAGRDKKPIG